MVENSRTGLFWYRILNRTDQKLLKCNFMSRAFRKLEQPETTFEYDQRTVMNCFPSALYTVDAYNIL